VVVEVVVFLGVLCVGLTGVLLRILENGQPAVCGLLTGSTGKGRIGADTGSGTGRCLMSSKPQRGLNRRSP